MGKGDEFKEYKKSKLTSGDIGIRIIGTTENLEFIRNLLKKNINICHTGLILVHLFVFLFS